MLGPVGHWTGWDLGTHVVLLRSDDACAHGHGPGRSVRHADCVKGRHSSAAHRRVRDIPGRSSDPGAAWASRGKSLHRTWTSPEGRDFPGAGRWECAAEVRHVDLALVDDHGVLVAGLQIMNSLSWFGCTPSDSGPGRPGRPTNPHHPSGPPSVARQARSPTPRPRPGAPVVVPLARPRLGVPVRRRGGRARRGRWWPHRAGRSRLSPCLRCGIGRYCRAG